MAGYQQQDAHEFFCFILEMMASTAGAGAWWACRHDCVGMRGGAKPPWAAQPALHVHKLRLHLQPGGMRTSAL